MKILDTNIFIKYISIDKSKEGDIFYITDDVQEEIELALTIQNENFPNNIKNIVEVGNFEPVNYYKNYKYFLNSYKNLVSFYNMRGLADVSILAAAKVIIDLFRQMLLPEDVEIWTDDSGLQNACNKEFKGVTFFKIVNPLIVKI